MTATLTRAALARAVAGRAGLVLPEARAYVGALIALIAESLAAGESLRLRNFGVLVVRRRPARRGRHPLSGRPYETPARLQVVFRPSPHLGRDACAGRRPRRPPAGVSRG